MQRPDFLCRAGYEGRSRVDDGLAAGSAEAQLVPNVNPACRNTEAATWVGFQNKRNRKRVGFLASPVHLDLPVGPPCDADVVQLPGVVLRVHPSQHQLPSQGCFRVSARNKTFLKRNKKCNFLLFLGDNFHIRAAIVLPQKGQKGRTISSLHPPPGFSRFHTCSGKRRKRSVAAGWRP